MTETVFGERMLITRGAIAVTSRDSKPMPEVADGDVLFAVRRIALTANNVTYATAGEMLGYWRFFPGPEGKGILPVWGFGEVVESRAPGFAVGDRFYGYWPLATHLLVREAVLAPGGFMDAAPHRQGLADIYNRYSRVEPRLASEEALDALFRPLFMTGWLIDSFLESGDVQVIGLTSAANRAFTEGLGSYTQVLTYDEVGTLEERPSVFVDFAGDRALTQAVHARLGDALKHSAIVGMTHWSQGGDAPLPGPAPTLFFAPAVAETTLAKLGATGFADVTGRAWAKFVPTVREKLAIETLHGLDAAEDAYRDLAAGRIGGASAIVVEFD